MSYSSPRKESDGESAYAPVGDLGRVGSSYNMYMALHIADPEVARLVSDLAKSERTTKTEALRRLLRKTMAERQKDEKRTGFREFALGLVADARLKKIAPATKEEMDGLWE